MSTLTTTKQLGQFLLLHGLRMRVNLSRADSFVVTLEKDSYESGGGKRRVVHEFDGRGKTFPEAVDAALRHYNRWGFSPERVQ